MKSSTNRPAAHGLTAAATVRRRVSSEQTVDAASSEIEARAARVVELREQYLAGTLQIDACKLASDIVSKHLKK